jgi:FkbM family methyltransferase
MSVRDRVIRECPEFLPAYDFIRNPESVEDLLFINGPYFKPFKGARVLDIGANVGILTAYWALKGATVTAYEPDPVSYQKLANLIFDLDLDVYAFNKAIWTYDGTVNFKGYKHQEEGRVSYQGYIQGDGHPVRCTTLTDALGDGVWDFVKIDIEGAEYEAVNMAALKGHAKLVHVELHD